jgi:hypothetical protein
MHVVAVAESTLLSGIATGPEKLITESTPAEHWAAPSPQWVRLSVAAKTPEASGAKTAA